MPLPFSSRGPPARRYGASGWAAQAQLGGAGRPAQKNPPAIDGPPETGWARPCSACLHHRTRLLCFCPGGLGARARARPRDSFACLHAARGTRCALPPALGGTCVSIRPFAYACQLSCCSRTHRTQVMGLGSGSGGEKKSTVRAFACYVIRSAGKCGLVSFFLRHDVLALYAFRSPRILQISPWPIAMVCCGHCSSCPMSSCSTACFYVCRLTCSALSLCDRCSDCHLSPEPAKQLSG